MEVQLAILKSLFESVDELAAKEFTQHLLGKKVVVAGTNPTGAIRREAAGRNDTMHMRMNGEPLAPRVQHAEKGDLCAKVSGIASDFEEGFRTGAEQKIIDDLFVLQHHRRQATRQGEDHMEIARREKLLLTRGDPAVPSGGLTLRAVAIAAAVIGDGSAMSAAQTVGGTFKRLCSTRASLLKSELTDVVRTGVPKTRGSKESAVATFSSMNCRTAVN
jgi:hypothetical protein